MKRRRILVLLALAVVAMGFVVFWPRGPKEPVIEGKRITVWIKEMLNQPVSSPEYEHAIQAMKASATNAVPYLLYEFTRPRSKWRSTLNRWASAIPVVGFRFEDDEERVRTAAWGLFSLGPEAAPALPTLAGNLGDPYRGYLARDVMGAIGDRALPWLLDATASTNPGVAKQAIYGLVRMTSECESAVQPALQLLRHTNSDIRMTTVTVAFSLSQFDRLPAQIVPGLAAALADPEPDVRSLAAFSLGNMGTNARPALPALLQLMTSTNDSVASAASNAVFEIDPAALPPRRP